MSRFETIAAEIGALVTEKNRFYGDSFAKCGDFLRLLYPDGIQPEQYTDALCMVRMFDKQMRIATHKTALGESPYRDLAGYSILGVAKDEASINNIYAGILDPWDKCQCGEVIAECKCADPIAHLDRNVKVKVGLSCSDCKVLGDATKCPIYPLAAACMRHEPNGG